MAIDLSTISQEELQREIRSRNTVKPLFVKDGKRYYDVKSYDRLLASLDENGKEKDYSPLDFDKGGNLRSAEPSDVVINLEAWISNAVYVDPKTKAFHVVYDTRTIRERDNGTITIALIPEYVLKKDGKYKDGYQVTKGSVSRDDFMKTYNESFGIKDMLKVLEIIDNYTKSHNDDSSTLSLADFGD